MITINISINIRCHQNILLFRLYFNVASKIINFSVNDNKRIQFYLKEKHLFCVKDKNSFKIQDFFMIKKLHLIKQNNIYFNNK